LSGCILGGIDSKTMVTLNPRAGWLGFWPKNLKAILDPENSRIEIFLKEQADRLPNEALVLDAGAGKKTYRKIFSRCVYQSTDMPGGFYCDPHDFECFLEDIQKPDDTYDAVVLTQVLEHVPDTWALLKEIKRVLKLNGRLLLSVPLTAPLHGELRHFYHFTRYASFDMAKKNGLEVSDLEKVGGAFWVLGKRLPDAFIKLFKQYDPFRAKKRGQSVLNNTLFNIGLLPLFFIRYMSAAYILRPLFYWLDFLISKKSSRLAIR